MVEPTVEEFNGNAVKYYAAVVKYNKFLKKESKHNYDKAVEYANAFNAAKSEIKWLKKKLKLADDIIQPALDILPDTYDEEINKYLNFKEK